MPKRVMLSFLSYPRHFVLRWNQDTVEVGVKSASRRCMVFGGKTGTFTGGNLKIRRFFVDQWVVRYH